ncbi:MAG TPA: hypothetical protein VE075_10030, partial [Thermoanaerobaculia bacterium]|nr:hypothetical protein [Thermoanaerobaculia bacterium]
MRRLVRRDPAVAVAVVALAVALLAMMQGARPASAAGPPLSPAEVKAAQRRLAELGYWAGSQAGPWDATWRHA